MSVRRRPTDWPAWLCLASVVWGAGVTVDAGSGAVGIAAAAGGLALYWVLARAPARVSRGRRDIPVLRLSLAIPPAVLAGYFLLTNDWTQPSEKALWLEPLRRWLAAQPLHLNWPAVHPNVVGGILAMWLPLQVASLLPGRSRRLTRPTPPVVWVLGVPALGLTGLGLLLSGLRGAWLALAVGVVLCGWWLLARVLTRRRPAATAALWAAGLTAGIAIVVFSPAGPDWLASRPDRLEVWSNSWLLVTDYLFTGLGFGTFTMAYSSYALLVHVPHTTHAHNLVMDIWLSQGLPGIVAFLWMVGAAVATAARQAGSGRSSRWRGAAFLSLSVVLLHGLVDDPYYGYGGAGALVLFIPVALLARSRDAIGDAEAGRGPLKPGRAAVLGLVVLALAAALPAVRAQFEANLGAWRQTRAELSVYRWPQWPLQDALRLPDGVNLNPATGNYRAALYIDPGNVTASRRLGQIELSRGRSADARRHLEAAYAGAPGQVATRQLYGESLAVMGDVAGAAALWQTLPALEDQLAIRRFWYEHIGDAASAQRIGAAIALSGH